MTLSKSLEAMTTRIGQRIHGHTSTSRLRTWVPPLVFGVLALNVVTWFPGGLPLGTGDGGLLAFYYHPVFLIHSFSSTWNADNITGLPAGQYISQLPEAIFFAVGHSTGLSYAATQGTFYWSIQFVAMLFMYKFLARLLPLGRSRELAAIFGALLYNFSPAVIENYWQEAVLNTTMIAFIPVILYLGLETPRRSLKWGLWAWSITIFAFSQVFWNPVFGGPVIICLVTSLAIGFRRSGLRWTRALVRVACSMTSSLVANLWFIVPLLLSTHNILTSASTQENPSAVLAVANVNNNAWNLILGVPNLPNSPAWNFRLPAWQFWYVETPFRIVALLLLALGVLGLVGHQTRRTAQVFLGLWVLGILLALGSKGITGSLFKWAFVHIPYFIGFRNPGNDFVPLYLSGYVVLATLGFFTVAEYGLSHRKNISARKAFGFGIAFVLLVIGVVGWPLCTSNVVGGRVDVAGNVLSSSVKIPEAYDVIGNYIRNNDSLDRTLVMPLAGSSYVIRKWGSGYYGINSTWQLLETPTLSDLQGGSAQPTKEFTAVASNIQDVLILAGSLDCKYVLLDRTIRIVKVGPQILPSYSIAEAIQGLSEIGAKLVLTSGPLSLYQMPTSLVDPLLTVSGPQGNATPSDVKWVGDAELTAVLAPAKVSRLVIFNENPNPGWKLLIRNSNDNEPIFGPWWWPFDLLPSPKSATPPLVVDASKNGWVIPASRSSETIVIYFSEESWFHLSLLISAEALVLLVVGSVYAYRRRSTGSRNTPPM